MLSPDRYKKLDLIIPVLSSNNNANWLLYVVIGFLKTPTKTRPHRPKNNKGIKIVYGIIRVFAYFFLAVATFLIALMLGHVSSLAAETVALPVPGKLVQADAGFPSGASMNMHILCKGPTDSTFPTIILASGAYIICYKLVTLRSY